MDSHKYDIKDCLSSISTIPCPLVIGNLNSVPKPYFTVAIPTYNRPELLNKAIQSAVDQIDFCDQYEIIVVDNEASKSPNETEKLISGLSIPNLYYYKNQKNIQASGNWNRCVLLARSNWVIMCHDDDWLKENCLSAMKDIIEKHKNDKKEIGYVRSSAESWYDPRLAISKKRQSRFRPNKDRTALIKRSFWDVVWSGGATWAGAPTCGTLINKRAFISVGGYNPDHSPCPDCYVPYHMLQEYNVYKTYYSFGYYRWSENDTYRKSTLLNLIKAYNDFLTELSEQYSCVKFFSNEHYADCAKYYISKGKEAGVSISKEEIDQIRSLNYSVIKLKLLYLCRKAKTSIDLIKAK